MAAAAHHKAPPLPASAGYPRKTTPNIDRLAEQSTVFANVVSAVPITLASRRTQAAKVVWLITDCGSKRPRRAFSLVHLFERSPALF
jgi:hypothetical protein